jgi:hypothetical protein
MACFGRSFSYVAIFSVLYVAPEIGYSGILVFHASLKEDKIRSLHC